ncbi:MAG: hypothetical protein IT585_14700 [candidate division Zixibacteria bacterium]|nr:hypothetical protein [candidate division Zixibacteria bacterium]
MTHVRSLSLTAAALVAALLLVAPATAATADVVFKVLDDELQRNTSQLVMENLERPYFINYTVDDYQQMEVSASLGMLVESHLERGRYLTTDLRVGSYELDNSNFASGFGSFGSDFVTLPVDDDYDAVRNQVYLATDRVYKGALETLSKKRAYLQTRIMPDRPADHIKLPPNKFLDKPEVFDIDQKFFEDLARPMSDVFRAFPAITTSELKVTASVVNQYLANSEGTRTLRGDRIYGFELNMAGRTPDGEMVSNNDRIIVNDFGRIPPRDQLLTWARSNAEKMNALITADTLEDYIGPVIFVGEAAGEFFRQLFSRHVSNMPAPMSDNDRISGALETSDFANKLNRRVLPPTFSVYNDPTLDRIGETPLIGRYEVDDAGGVPKRTTLVENGKLVNFLIGIAPTKKIKEPTGSARGAVSKDVTAKPANLIFESTDKISFDKLKANLIAMCKDIDLPYGLIVRRLRDLSAPSTGLQMFGQAQAGGEGLTIPFEIYRLYPDGREVPVRGLQFSSVTSRILRDIVQTDNSRYVYNYLIGNDYEMPATIVTPAVLVEEMELKKADTKVTKPPLLPSPLATN